MHPDVLALTSSFKDEQIPPEAAQTFMANADLVAYQHLTVLMVRVRDAGLSTLAFALMGIIQKGLAPRVGEQLADAAIASTKTEGKKGGMPQPKAMPTVGIRRRS